ncbi:MAG: hypothetical protein ACFFCD_06025 [Promethearchaeota archaeon]
MPDKVKDIPSKLLEGYLKKLEMKGKVDPALVRESVWNADLKAELNSHLSSKAMQVLENIHAINELLEKIEEVNTNIVEGELSGEMAEVLINYAKTLDIISQEISYEDAYISFEINDPVTQKIIPIQDEYLDIAIALRTAGIVFGDIVIGVLQKSQEFTAETYDRVSNLYLKASDLFHTASLYSSLITGQSIPEFLLSNHLDSLTLNARAEAQHILAVKEDRILHNFVSAAQIYAGASILFKNASKLSLIKRKSEEADGRSKFELGYSCNAMALATVNEDPCEAIGYWKRAMHHFETGARLFPSDRLDEMTATANNLIATLEQNLNLASKNCVGIPYSAEEVPDFEAKAIVSESKPIIQPKRGLPPKTAKQPAEELVVTEESIVTEEPVVEKTVVVEKLAERIELNKPLAEESVSESGTTPIIPIPGTRYAVQLQASGGQYLLRVFGGKELKKEVTLRSTGHYDIMGSIASSVSLNISPHILSKVALSLKKLLQAT